MIGVSRVWHYVSNKVHKDEMPSSPFPETLILWRMERGLTQQALAQRAGMPRPNLCAIERGRRDVTLRTLRRLARALEIPPGILADGIPPRASEGQRPLDREEMERVADAVVYGKAVRNDREGALARALRSVVWHRLSPRERQGGDARRGFRSAAGAWLWLQSAYPPSAVRSLLQRISDRQVYG